MGGDWILVSNKIKQDSDDADASGTKNRLLQDEKLIKTILNYHVTKKKEKNTRKKKKKKAVILVSFFYQTEKKLHFQKCEEKISSNGNWKKKDLLFFVNQWFWQRL